MSSIFVEVLKATSQYAGRDYKGALDVTFKKVDEMIASEDGQKKLQSIRYKAS